MNRIFEDGRNAGGPLEARQLAPGLLLGHGDAPFDECVAVS